jgi:myo-inositol 2-dehydrogenase / D-chiro-inositol 1-dehydrogenase
MQSRRKFATGLLLVSAKTAFSYQANSTIELGIIGCGNRGKWISDLFVEYSGARFVAAADVFADPLAKYGDKYKVEKRYTGMDGYRELVQEKLDAVVIETPPYYHPEHAEAAVNAGKHVFSAKPIATDVVGSKQFLLASQTASKRGLSFWVDFQTRNRPVFQEAVARVHRGEIGEPGFGHIYYHSRPNVVHPADGLSSGDAELKNWLHSRRLSGDIIVEQNIHVIDVANWYMRDHPLKAWGTGGRRIRKVGDVSDHFIVTYFYPNDVKVDFSSVQFANGYGDLCIRLYGSAGTLDAHYGGSVKITGKTPWTGSEKDDTFRGGAVQNIKDFVEAVRSGKPINNGEESVKSNLTGILGRMAASREQVVTWDEMMRVTERYDGKNKL